MDILFIHPNMPGQYKHLVRYFTQQRDDKGKPLNRIVFLTKPKEGLEIPGVKKLEYKVEQGVDKHTHRYLAPLQGAVHHSQEIWRQCLKMREAGFVPDVICGHLGWGGGLFIKDIFPDSPIVGFAEFYYNASGSDVGFLGEGYDDKPDERARVMMRNAHHLYHLTYSDWLITPTEFQKKQHPDAFHHKMSVLHDGVDTYAAKPGGEGVSVTLPSGLRLTKDDEVITYISRNFEPYRGFEQFMEAASIIQKRRPNAHIVMVGADGVSYGKKPPEGQTYRRMMLEKFEYDKARLHMLPPIAHDKMVSIMQISSAHIYLTVPFVLSWSMMEAMSAGCLVIASRTEPVMEVIEDGVNGLLVDFFSPLEIADKVDDVFVHPTRMSRLRKRARRTIEERYALSHLLPRHVDIVTTLASGGKPKI